MGQIVIRKRTPVSEKKSFKSREQLNYSVLGDKDIDKTMISDENLDDILIDDEPSADNTLNQKLLSNEIEKVLTKLPPEAQIVIRCIFGIGCEEKNITEISKNLHLSRDRVRSLKEKALMSLSKNKQLQNCFCYD
ncbi:MAG TPA: sigma factor-like helix-turn-helix DNA-binding protein [Candidatus Paceibacterota bacterium]|nr:sigma factor-like helix-turn-helix DNA-binding protein [Candidatus Paceibacterota bacterium]